MAAAVVCFLWSGAVGADEAEPIRFSYDAPPACPDLAELQARIRARTSRFAPSDAPDAREFRIRVVGEAPSRGAFTVKGPDGRGATRSFAGASCDEVVSALALAAALAIDPLALVAPQTPPPPPAVPLPNPRPIAPPPPPALPVLPTPRAEAPPPPPSSRVTVGAYASLAWPATPNPLYGGGAFSELRLRAPFEPSFRLGLEGGASADVTNVAARVAFSRVMGVVQACAIAWRPWGVARMELCARMEAGALRARAEDIARAISTSRPWLAPGAAIGLRVALPGDFFLDGQLALTVPLWRDDYRLLPDTDVLHVPPVSAAAGLAIGYDLP